MSASGAPALYTPELLGLSVALADYPLDRSAPCIGSASSRTCGSRIEMSLVSGDGQRIAQVGMRVSACAIGQAAATIFARGATGRDRAAIAAASAAIEDWLAGGSVPEWPGFEPLTTARPHKGRHGALLLPWRAALAALSNCQNAG